MNISEVKSILPKNFITTDFSKKENLVKVEKRYNQNVVSNYFIDYDTDITEVDIKTYQEKYISDDFFNSPGNLQWNFYLIFLRENFSEEFKKRIESDISYARKFVFNKEEFEDYLKYEKSKNETEVDIVGEWKSRLQTVGLQEVFSNENFNKAIPRFISGKTLTIEKLNKIDAPANKEENFTIKRISKLNLNDNYRKYPENRSYLFAKVNLIKGVNGTGKTSLLEAAELVITGKHQSNEVNKSFNNSVNAIYTVENGEQEDSVSITALKKYKARDYYWYNKPIGKFNELVGSFNRYNFYNSDSAYKLSNSPNKTDFLDYLSNIALGPEFGTIQKRLYKFQQELQTKSRYYLEMVDKEKQRKLDANNRLKDFKRISDPNTLLNTFLNSTKDFNWKKFLPKSIEDNTMQFEQDYKSLITLVNTLMENKTDTEKNTKEQLRKTLALKSTVKEKTKNIAELNQNLKADNNIIIAYERLIELLDNAIKFLSEPDIFKIKTIDFDIKTLKRQTTEFKKYYEEIKSFDNKLKDKDSFIYKDYKIQLQENLKLKQNQKNDLNEQLKNIKSSIDNLKSIIIDIKYFGKQYLEHKTHIEFCPLCESAQTKSQLRTTIEKEIKGLEELKGIKVLNTNISLLEKEIMQSSNELNSLEEYELVIKNLVVDYEMMTLSDINTEINIHFKTNETRERNLKKLESINLKLIAKGYSLDDFLKTESLISTEFENREFSIENRELFKKDLNDYKSMIEEIKNKRALIIKEKEEKEVDLKELLGEEYDTEGYLEKIDYNINELNSIINYFKEIKSFINIKPNDSILETKHNIENMYEYYKSYKNELINFKEVSFAKADIEKADKIIKENKVVLERIKKGLVVINDILKNQNQEKVLGSFFRRNQEEIQEVFQNIHSPKEFIGVQFVKNEIRLLKAGDENYKPITQISTGQRSALALSIFLTLNKKLNKGPKIIIFDDPVTYTDDLNILSFMDYLRDLIINEDRQVFFATASNKIADLFEKKFHFLDSDFKKFELSRQ